MGQLSEGLEIKEGVTAFVGGGGKTTAIFNLAKELSQKGKKVIVTTTTKMFVPKPEEVEQLLIEPSMTQIKEALSNTNCIAIGGALVEGKIHGVTKNQIEQMSQLADYVLVEADGSKCLPIKAPSDHEPVLPNNLAQVVIVVGMRALGRPLEKVFFRKEKAIEILGVKDNHALTIEDILRLIQSPAGLSKGIGNHKSTVILNQSDVLSMDQLSKVKSYFKEEAAIPVILASLRKGSYEKI